MQQSRLQTATIAYVAPFVAFIVTMALERAIAPESQLLYPLRLLVVGVVLAVFSRNYIQFRPSYPLASIGIGIAVFLIWIGPDRLFGYRHFWLFDNPLAGSAASSISPGLKNNWWFVAFRSLGSVAVVPLIEELFWRGWLMRWTINTNFLKVPLGTYTPAAFWTVALLFASEHGPYWEVGLAAGILYNWWLIRTRNLADCILAHAVTNGILAIYVVVTGEWQYWL